MAFPLTFPLCRCLSTSAPLPQWFNVDTVDVLGRLRVSFWPFTAHSFFETIAEAPDMYGPLWISATLVFVIGVASNMSSWVAFAEDEEVCGESCGAGLCNPAAFCGTLLTSLSP